MPPGLEASGEVPGHALGAAKGAPWGGGKK